MTSATAAWPVSELNRWLAYHEERSAPLMSARTALQSQLIPVTNYIIVSAVEAYRRWPEMVETIAAAMPPEEVGRRGAVPGSRVNPVHLWSLANIFLLGRFFEVVTGKLDAGAEPERSTAVLDFWRRCALAYRGDGMYMNVEAGGAARPFPPEAVEALFADAVPVDESERASLERANALLTSWLFLLHFDTRVGVADFGPWDLGGGRVGIVRDFHEPAFEWAPEPALPRRKLSVAYVLEGSTVSIDDWGTSHATVPRLLDTCVAANVPGGLGTLLAAADRARPLTKALYREVVGLDRRQKIVNGASVYFGFLAPFAEVAGCLHDLDWRVPVAAHDTLDLMVAIDEIPGQGAAAVTHPRFPEVPT